MCNFVENNSTFSEVNKKILIHELVKKSGKHNFEGCRIPINNKINTSYMRQILSTFQYNDMLVCDFLEFGFPINLSGNGNAFSKSLEASNYKNYKGANDFPV
jgi:hypothetical protein